MSKKVEAFHEYIVHDLLQNVPDITSKRMFGGYGIYKNSIIFAIITSESELFFKVDDELKILYKQHGSHPFVYSGHTTRKPIQMSYWMLPVEIMEDSTKLNDWIDASVQASMNAKKK